MVRMRTQVRVKGAVRAHRAAGPAMASKPHSEQDQIGFHMAWPALGTGRLLEAGGDICPR